jgi:hypothetical protein
LFSSTRATPSAELVSAPVWGSFSIPIGGGLDPVIALVIFENDFMSLILALTFCKVCDFNESEVVFIRQVGVKTPNKVRPIVVGLRSTSRRDEIVARGRRARIGIDENLTPNQLENKRRVKDEVKLRNEDGCLYKLVGSAGNYKSVRVRTIQ